MALMHTMRIVEDILCLYFCLGISNQEILECLTFIHVRVKSIKSLNRLTRKLGLLRRKHHGDILDVATFCDGKQYKMYRKGLLCCTVQL